MLVAKIIARGRGPEIEGTRINVYDVLDYHKTGWHRDIFAATLDLSSQQVDVAIRYIDEHRDEVMADYKKSWHDMLGGIHPSFRPNLTPLTSGF